MIQSDDSLPRTYLPSFLLVIMLLATFSLVWIAYAAMPFEEFEDFEILISILVPGVFVSFSLFLLARWQVEKYKRALILAGEMTVELETARRQADGLARKMELILNSAGEGIFGLDLQGYGIFVNPAAEKMLGFAPQEMIGQQIHVLTHHSRAHNGHDEIEQCPIHQTLHDGLSHETAETVFWRKDGVPFPVSYTSTPIYEFGKLAGAVVTFTDITEHLRAEKDRFVRKVSEQANKAKSTFLANMSHEIRTPMNAVLGCTQLLLNDQSFSTRQMELLRIIERSGGHLLDMINDILDISMIEAGRVILKEEIFDVHDLLQDMKAVFSMSAEAKGLRFFLDYEENLPQYILADGGKLRQVLVNLLGNAIKNTEKGGVVLRVRTDCPPGQAQETHGDMQHCSLLFEVEDSGCGISKEILDKIFSPFEQPSGGVKPGGTGLGLPISSKLVQLMGGRLSVESKVDIGSCFFFRMQVLVQQSEQECKLEKVDTRPVVGFELGADPFRILVVDDSDANRILLRRILEMAGFTVVEASNGQEAIDLFEKFAPQAVLMDIQMPVMDGLEATRRLKATEKGRAVPFIAITGNAFDEDQKKGMAIGMAAYLCKPFRAEELLRMLGGCLDLRSQYEEAVSSPSSREQVVTPEMIALLPQELLASLRQAVAEGDMACLRELIARVKEQDRAAAVGLQSLADCYDYQRLDTLLKKGEQSHG